MDFIELLRYILYGVVQGFLEVLPISSSGHVAFFQAISEDGFTYSTFFLIVINMGSLAAIILYFKSFLKEMICHAYRYLIKKDEKLEYKYTTDYAKSIIIGIIPVAVVGTIFALTDLSFGKYSLIVIGLGGLLTST